MTEININRGNTDAEVSEFYCPYISLGHKDLTVCQGSRCIAWKYIGDPNNGRGSCRLLLATQK